MLRALSLIGVLFISWDSSAATLRFEDVRLETGSVGKTRYDEQGFHLRGSFAHTGGSVSNRPSNGSRGFVSVALGKELEVFRPDGPFFVPGPNGENIPVEPGKLPFNALSIDLAEYSTFYSFPADITFSAVTQDGLTLTHTMKIDGAIDSSFTTDDFESFAFPPEFSRLVSLSAKYVEGVPFAFDNLQLRPVPEPAAAFLGLLAAAGFVCRRV